MQLVEFIGNHLMLFLALAVIAGLLFTTFLGDRLKGIRAITAMEATRLMNHQGAVIIDVRERKEFEDGHILGAMHIPLGSITQQLKKLESYKNKPVIISCQSGNRSGMACGQLKKQGFEQVYNLKGGIMAWRNDCLPIEK